MPSDSQPLTEATREWMINHQIRPWQVDDERVLHSLARVPREAFVPSEWRSLAFAEIGLPLPCGQTMLKPLIEGRLLQLLAAQSDQSALLIGTGSGYLAACLGQLAREVVAIDIHDTLTRAGAERLVQLKINNVSLQTADFTSWDPGRRFDRILVTGSMPLFDRRLPEWLNTGGRLVLICGSAPAMRVETVDRSDSGYIRQTMFETDVQPLVNVPQPQAFSF